MAEEEATSSGAEAPLDAAFEDDTFSEHPELFVGAAFIGGFVLAQILKRFGP